LKAMPGVDRRLSAYGAIVAACGAASTFRCGCRSSEVGCWSDFPATGSPDRDRSVSRDVFFGQPGPHVLRMTAPSTGQIRPVRDVD
jgi:hypothetical protein